MTTSCLNSSQRLPMNHYAQNKQTQLFSLYVKKRVNAKLKILMKSVKNNFGVVTCIGSDSFYVFTRQMLLHLDFNKAINLTQQNIDDFDDYRSQQFNLQNIDIDVINRKKSRRQSIGDQLDTSFARANSEQIKNILHAQVNQIQSQYEFSHNQLIEKQLQPHHFKKSSSSFLAQTPVIHKEQKSSTKNYIQKNQETLSQAQKNYSSTKFDKFSPTEKNKSPNFGQDSFHKDIRQFKQSMEHKKIHESMRQKGMRRVIRNGQEKYVQKNDFIRFYSYKEIGTDKQKRPIQWFYCELKDTNPQSIQSAYLMSSTIVFDLPFKSQPTRQQFEKEIRDYFQFYRRMQSEMNRYDDSSSDMPEVVVICPIEDSEKMENDKGIFRALFNQIEGFYITQSKKNVAFSQSPFNQFHKNQSPSKSKLPPTPKRMPMTHKPSQNNGLANKKRVRLQFRMISQQLEKSGVLRQNYSRMRQITSQGRVIFNQQSIKTMCGNWVTSQCYVNLLQKLGSSLPYVDIETFYQQWEDVFEDFIKSTMEQAAVRYEEKVNELIVGKTMISQARLEQAHQVAKKQTLRQFSQKKIGTSRVYIETSNQIKSGLRLPSMTNLSQSRKISTSRKLVQSRKDLDSRQNQGQVQQEQLLNLVQSRLQQQKQQLSIKAKQDSIKWCRKFLATQYQQIRRKLVSNEIKSLSNYKQQLQFLKDIYKKKLQNYSALQYEMIQEYSQFLIQNIFPGLDLLLAKQREQWKQKVKKQSQKFEQSQTQMKQMKKLLTQKQRSLAEQKIQLENKLHEFQSSLQNFSHEIEVKNNQILYLKTQQQQKLLQQQNIFKEKITTLRNTIQQLNKDIATKTNDFLYLQSELQKQQLLHQQTQANYQQILLTYKNNITQLQKKNKQLKQLNTINEQKIKSSFKKQQMDQQIQHITHQYETKILHINELLEQKQKQMQQQRTIYERQVDNLKDQIKIVQNKNVQLLLEHKIVQQKLLEIQSRLPRYKSYQVQLQKTQKDKQQLVQKIQSLSKQKAIIEQKSNLDKQQFQKTKQKLIEVFKTQSQSLHQQIDQLKKINQTYHKKLYQNKKQMQTQTLFTIRQKQQLTIKTKCKHCKQNQIKLTQALNIVDMLNQSYHKMKNTFLNNQCIHCLQMGNQKKRLQ